MPVPKNLSAFARKELDQGTSELQQHGAMDRNSRLQVASASALVSIAESLRSIDERQRIAGGSI
jgi:hypothetical protein